MPLNYIFDLDGTLIDSQQDIINSINKACENASISIVKPIIIGKSIDAILKMLFPDTDILKIEEIKNLYRNIYDNMSYPNTREFPGTSMFLKDLKENDCNLFLLTNKPNIPTNKIIKKLYWDNIFTDIYTIDRFNTVKNKSEMLKNLILKYNIERKNSIYIGDTLEDIIAAKENNIISAAVTWGYEVNKDKLFSEADFYIETFDYKEINLLIEKIIGLISLY